MIQGTPMCISVELSSPIPIHVRASHPDDVDGILDRLKKVELEQPEIFKLAFPNDTENAEFMEKLVNALDRFKRLRRFQTDPQQQHLPHHDVESFYWVFLWSFVRALPINREPENENDQNVNRHFCNKLLGITLTMKSIEVDTCSVLILHSLDSFILN